MSGGSLAIFLFMILLAIIADVLVIPLVMDYTSFLAKLGGCGSSTHVPWYARSDDKYDLDALAMSPPGFAYSAADNEAIATFDLSTVLTMIEKDKFTSEDVTDGTLEADGKHVVVKLNGVNAATTTAIVQTATVKLAHSTLMLTVQCESGFTIATDDVAPTPVIEYLVELKLGESENTVLIADGDNTPSPASGS
jgi:hypothetical protein